MDRERQRRQVDDNYEAFLKQVDELVIDHQNEFAVMRDGDIVAILPTAHAALREAHRRFPDEIFSIQEVTTEPDFAGVYLHADT